jgi:flagellar biosynthesis protein FlhB
LKVAMPALLRFIVRLALVAAGLLFAASVAVAVTLMLVGWTLRAGWAKLTGRPVSPFVVRIDPRRGFERMYSRAADTRTPRADSVQPHRAVADVTDVEPKTTGR